LSYYDTLDVADRIVVPVLVQIGMKDNTCPPEPIKTMFGKIASGRKKLREWPEADHSDMGAERWKTSLDFLEAALSAP
jgi:cephalosporin-C deacetylase